MADVEKQKKQLGIGIVGDTSKLDEQMKVISDKPITVSLDINIKETLDAINGALQKMQKSFSGKFEFSGIQNGLDDVIKKIQSVTKTFNEKKPTEFNAIKVDLVGMKNLKETVDSIKNNIESMNSTKVDLDSFKRLETTFKNIETLINSIVKGMKFDAIRPSTQIQEEIEATTNSLSELAKTEERINKLERSFSSRTYKQVGAEILSGKIVKEDEKQVKRLIGFIEEYIKLGGDLSNFKFNFVNDDNVKVPKTFLDVLRKLQDQKQIDIIDQGKVSQDIEKIRELRLELSNLEKEKRDALIRENRDLNVSFDEKSIEDFSKAIGSAVEKLEKLEFVLPEDISFDGLSPENLDKIITKLDEIVTTIKNIGESLSSIDFSKMKMDFDSEDSVSVKISPDINVSDFTTDIENKIREAGDNGVVNIDVKPNLDSASEFIKSIENQLAISEEKAKIDIIPNIFDEFSNNDNIKEKVSEWVKTLSDTIDLALQENQPFDVLNKAANDVFQKTNKLQQEMSNFVIDTKYIGIDLNLDNYEHAYNYLKDQLEELAGEDVVINIKGLVDNKTFGVPIDANADAEERERDVQDLDYILQYVKQAPYFFDEFESYGDGYFSAIKQFAEDLGFSIEKLQEALKNTGFIDNDLNPTFKHASAGDMHDLGVIGDKYVILGRGDDQPINLGDAKIKQEKINELADVGVNIARIVLLKAKKDVATNSLFGDIDDTLNYYEVQERKQGYNHRKLDGRDILRDLSKDQLAQFLRDARAILDKGLAFEAGGDNFLVNQRDGLIPIDLAAPDEGWWNLVDTLDGLVKYFNDYFYNESKFLDNLNEAHKEVENEQPKDNKKNNKGVNVGITPMMDDFIENIQLNVNASDPVFVKVAPDLVDDFVNRVQSGIDEITNSDTFIHPMSGEVFDKDAFSKEFSDINDYRNYNNPLEYDRIVDEIIDTAFYLGMWGGDFEEGLEKINGYFEKVPELKHFLPQLDKNTVLNERVFEDYGFAIRDVFSFIDTDGSNSIGSYIQSYIKELNKGFNRLFSDLPQIKIDPIINDLSIVKEKINEVFETLKEDVVLNIDSSVILNTFDDIVEKYNEVLRQISTKTFDYSSMDSITDETGNILKWYRGVNGVKSGFVSDKDDGTFLTTNKELAQEYAGELGKVYEAELKMKNVLELDVGGDSSKLFEYLGNQTDDASIRITELSKNIKSKSKVLSDAREKLTSLEEKLMVFENTPGMSAMADTIRRQLEDTKSNVDLLENELYDLQDAYDAISDDRSNPYGMVGTHDISEWAKNNGFDGVIFNNIKTTVDDIKELIGTTAVIFSSDQLNNLKVLNDFVPDDLTDREDSGISKLELSLDEIIKKINNKTEAFKRGAIIVADSVSNETKSLGKLISSLKIINDYLDKIAKFSGLDLTKLQPSNNSLLNDNTESRTDALKKKLEDINILSRDIDMIISATNGELGGYFGLNFDDYENYIKTFEKLKQVLSEFGYVLENYNEDTDAFIIGAKIVDQEEILASANDSIKKGIEPESKEMSELAKNARDAALAKEEFAEANEEVNESIREQYENVRREVFDRIGKTDDYGLFGNTDYLPYVGDYDDYDLKDIGSADDIYNSIITSNKQAVASNEAVIDSNNKVVESENKKRTLRLANKDYIKADPGFQLTESPSGQLSMFDGVEERQERIEQSVKQTNAAIEGQIDLFQYMDSLHGGDDNFSDDVENKKMSELEFAVQGVTKGVNAKTNAFIEEEKKVKDVIDSEKQKIGELSSVLDDVSSKVKTISEMEIKISQSQSDDSGSKEEELTEEQKRVKDVAKAYDDLSDRLDRYLVLKDKEIKGTLGVGNAKSATKEIKDINDITKNIEDAVKGSNKYENATGEAAKAQERFNQKLKDTSKNLGEYYEKSFNSKLEKAIDPENDSELYLKNVSEIRDKIKDLSSYFPIDFTNEKSISDIKETSDIINSLISKLNTGVSTDELNSLSAGMSKYYNKNSAAPRDLRNQLKALIDETERLSNGLEDVDRLTFNKLKSEFVDLRNQIEKTGKTGASMSDKIGKKFKDLFAYFATYVSIQDAIQVVRQGYQYVAEIDKQMIELEKVSSMSDDRLAKSFDHATEAAKDLGSTISDVVSATSDWSKLGYDADAAEELAEVAIVYKNVGDNIDINQANESLISTLQGFQLDASEAMGVVDKFNEVANKYAIDSAGIGEALKRSAASFNSANTDLSKSIALITATNEVLQDPDSVGTLWKTMSARLRGATTELAALGEETDEYTETTSKLKELIQSLTGFDIMEDEDTFKDIYDIILGIGKEWNNLTDVEQASLGEALAGKRNANALYAVLGNLKTLEGAYETAENSAGSAMREQEKWEEGLEAKTNKLKASLEELATTVMDSGFLGWIIDAGRTIIEILTKIIDTVGTLPTLIGSVTAALSIKSAVKNSGGRVKKLTLNNMLPAC